MNILNKENFNKENKKEKNFLILKIKFSVKIFYIQENSWLRCAWHMENYIRSLTYNLLINQVHWHSVTDNFVCDLKRYSAPLWYYKKLSFLVSCIFSYFVFPNIHSSCNWSIFHYLVFPTCNTEFLNILKIHQMIA